MKTINLQNSRLDIQDLDENTNINNVSPILDKDLKTNEVLNKKEMKKQKKEEIKSKRDKKDKIAIFLATWFFLLSLDRLYVHEFKEALIKFILHWMMFPTLGYVIFAIFSALVQHQDFSLVFSTFDYVLMGISFVGSIFMICWDVHDNLELRKNGCPLV